MKKSVLFTKEHFLISLTILLILAQFFLPYKSNANSNINDRVISIHLIGEHDSDKYWFGQCLIPLKINAYMESGNHVGSIPVEKSWISGYNSEKLGKQTVTITYGGKTTTFTVTVVDYLKNIDVVGLKQNYKVGEALDLSSASVTEITASGIKSTGKPLSANMISGFSTSTPGVKKLTINYRKNELGETVKLNTFITVSDYIAEPSTPTTSEPTQFDISQIDTSEPQVSTQTTISQIDTSTPPVSTQITDLFNESKKIKTSINKNEEIVNNNEDNKISSNNILKNTFELSEKNLNKETRNSITLFILIFTKLSFLFI